MHATQHQDGTHAEPVTRRIDGQPETDADRRFFDLREAGYTGWIDQDGYAADGPQFVTSGLLDSHHADEPSGIDRDGSPVGTLGACEICGTGDTPVQLVQHPDAVRPFMVCADAAACMAHFHDQPIPVVLIPAPVGQDVQEPPASVLRSAADYLERHGWIQGCYYDVTSGVFTPPACLVGAIGMVCYGGPVEAPAQHFDDPGFLDFEEAVLHLDRWLLVEDGTESYEFNDARGRTLADVTSVLRRAAAVPAAELIDALRAIDDRDTQVAGLLPVTPDDEREPAQHADYPHTAGTLYDCPACEAECFCSDGFRCLHCALDAESADGDPTGGGGA